MTSRPTGHKEELIRLSTTDGSDQFEHHGTQELVEDPAWAVRNRDVIYEPLNDKLHATMSRSGRPIYTLLLRRRDDRRIVHDAEVFILKGTSHRLRSTRIDTLASATA